MPEAVRIVFIAATAVAVAAALRYVLVEPAAMSAACETAPWQGRCALRSLTIQIFIDERLGVFALSAALLATLTRQRWLAVIALAAASAGLVLYSATLAACAALLAALVLVRRRT